MPKRPLNNEIIKKVHARLAAARTQRRALVLRKHLVADLEALGLTSENDYWRLIEKLLGEILVASPVVCHAGGHPPQRSYEACIKDAELWAYAWDSPSQRRRMYLKLVPKNAWYFHVDCHESTEK